MKWIKLFETFVCEDTSIPKNTPKLDIVEKPGTEGVESIINEKLILGRNERVHISTNKIDSIKDIEQRGTWFGKPNGLWYGFGDEWIYFAKHGFADDSNLSFKKKKYGYKIYPNMEKIIVLKTKNDVDNFVDRYLSKVPDDNQYSIDWVKVSEDYSGIEIPSYNELGMRSWGDPFGNSQKNVKRYSWLYPWDVSSGCIWKSNGVSRIREL